MPEMLTDLTTGGALTDLGLLALQGAAIVCLAWLASTLARRRSAAARHLIWAVAVVALLALPAAHIVPGLELPVLPATDTPRETGAAPTPTQVETTPSAPLVFESAEVHRRSEEATSAANPSQIGLAHFQSAVLLIYVAGMTASLMPLLVGLVRARRLRASAIELEGRSAWRDLLAGLRRRLRLDRPVWLGASEVLTVPVTWGWRRPVVLVPQKAVEWTASERQDAVLHELAHVVRGDWAVQVLARLACAIHWFNPLAWLAARRLAAEAERACDDRVLIGGATPPDYADQLVSLARRARHGWAPGYAAIAMARQSDLGRRVAALLDEKVVRGTIRRRTVIVTTIVTLLLTMAAAPVRLVHAESDTGEKRGHEIHRPDGRHTGDRPLAGPRATALMRTAAAGAEEKVALLLERGADPNEVVPGQGTALILAAAAARDDVVELLLDRGADPNLVDRAGNRWTNLPRSALNGAARAGCVDTVRLLLDAGAEIDAAPAGDATALMAAARHGHLDVVELLVERGADVDIRIPGDGTPLIEAAREGHGAIVELLLDRGADPDTAVTGDGNPLVVAAAGGHVEIVRLLLDRGADPDIWVPGDESALYHAVERGDRRMVKLLLDRGADPTRTWPGDGNALAVAAENSDREMLELLLDRLPGDGSGVDLDRDREDETEASSDRDADLDTERDSGFVEARDRAEPGAWLVADATAHRLIVPEGAVVEFEGKGHLEFPPGPVSVSIPPGHRLVVDGEPVTDQAVITGDPSVRLVGPDGRVAWRLRARSRQALDGPGTRIEDTDPSRGARIDTSGDRFRFYIAVDEQGRETFFEPEA